MNQMQLTLPLEGLVATVQVEKEPTIQERFEAFHKANPQVYAALRSLSLQMLSNGVRSYGIKGLFEILRWEFAMQTAGKPYRLCNSYSSRYARLLIQENPQLDGFFETRSLRERNREVSK